MTFPKQIQEKIDAGMQCGSGVRESWLPLVIKLNEDVTELDPTYVIDQIKEKFGGLRYYISFSTDVSDYNKDRINQLIGIAEEKSYNIK